jgi:hypothetical protein
MFTACDGMGYRVFSQMFVPLSRGLAVLTGIIHERFYCNRGDGSQNLMRYSLFAPRSCKGRSTSLARWRRTWTRPDLHPCRRACRSVGQHTVSSMPPSRRWVGPEACLASSYKGGQPPCTIPTKGSHPLRNPQAVTEAHRLAAPRACLAWRLRDFATNRHE